MGLEIQVPSQDMVWGEKILRSYDSGVHEHIDSKALQLCEAEMVISEALRGCSSDDPTDFSNPSHAK